MPSRDASRRALAPWVGLVATSALVALAIGVPMLTGWDTATRRDDHSQFPPLHGYWSPGWGRGTAPAAVVALLTWLLAAEWSLRLPWRRLLLGSYVVGLGWLLALAYVDGPSASTGRWATSSSTSPRPGMSTTSARCSTASWTGSRTTPRTTG